MKDTQYFSHNFNARNDGKMVRLLMKKGAEGIGLYWCIIEMLYEENGYLMRTECERIAFELRVSEDSINEVIFEYDLFQYDDEKFWSNSALERISLRNAKADKARQSAEKRWQKNPEDANALRTQSDGNAIKERKGKEIKEKESIESETKKQKSQSVEIPPEFSKQLSDTFLLFLEYRKQRKIRAYTEIGLSQAFELINKFRNDHGEQCVIDALKDSMAKGYQGFFPEKHIPKSSPAQQQRQQSKERIEAIKRQTEQENAEKRKKTTEVESLWKQYSNLDPEDQMEIESLAEEKCAGFGVPRGKIGFEEIHKGQVMKIFRARKGI